MAKVPIKTLRLKKVPSSAKGFFKEAVKTGAIGVVVDISGEVVVHVYNEIKGPLGDFFNNLPSLAEQVGHDAAVLVQEAFDEVKKVANVCAHEVEYFVVHTVPNEAEKLGHTIENAARFIWNIF